MNERLVIALRKAHSTKAAALGVSGSAICPCNLGVDCSAVYVSTVRLTVLEIEKVIAEVAA